LQLHDYVRSAWARLPLILLVVVAVVLLGTRGTTVDPRYTAHTQILYSVQQLPAAADTVSHATTQLASLAEIIASPEILQPVIDDLGLDESVGSLSDDVSATITDGTYVLTVSASADTAGDAERLAAAVAASVVAYAQDLVLPAMIDPALVPAQTSAPAAVGGLSARDVVKNLVIGLVLGAGLSVLLDLVDPRVRTRNQLARLSALPIVSEVAGRGPGRAPSVASHVVLSAPDLDRRIVCVVPAGSGAVHEAIARDLADDLVPLSSSVLLITTSDPAPSSIVTTRNLADSFPDLRPRAIEERLHDLARQFDSVVVVTHSLESSTLPLVVARCADSTLLVVDGKRDTRRATTETISALRTVEVPSVEALLVRAGR